MKQSPTQRAQHQLCADYDAHLTRQLNASRRIGSQEHLTRELDEAREANRATIDRMQREYHRRKGHGTHVTMSQPQEREYPLPENEDLCELIREHPAFRTQESP